MKKRLIGIVLLAMMLGVMALPAVTAEKIVIGGSAEEAAPAGGCRRI